MSYEQNLMDLAVQFTNELAKASHSTWRAAAIATEMRKGFRERVEKGEKGWTDFCREVLKKNEATVGAYLRGYKYIQQFAPDKLEALENLPPVSLVSELAAVREERREEMHQKLFTGNYSAAEFRRELEEVRGTKAPKGNAGANKASDDATPSDAGAEGGQGHASNAAKVPQLEFREAQRGELTTIIPAQVEKLLTCTLAPWKTVTELHEHVLSVLTANETKLSTEWTCIMLPPQHRAELDTKGGE